MKILVVADHDNKSLNKSTLSTITAALEIGPTEVLVLGSKCSSVADYASKIQGINKIYINDSEYYKNFLSENCAKFISEFSDGFTHILFSNNATGLIFTNITHELSLFFLLEFSVGQSESSNIRVKLLFRKRGRQVDGLEVGVFH